MGSKTPNIGLRQARAMCQMSYDKRLDFLAEGLPLIYESAEGYWAASLKLRGSPREAEVLSCHAVEEAAKVLILMDAVRCPKKLVSRHIGKIVGWFYNHLARLIYAEAIGWRPTHLNELREYVRPLRQSHFVEGSVGEFIFPNWSLYMRESQMYADVACGEDTGPYWHAPLSDDMGMSTFEPRALTLTKAMYALGMFSAKGLMATSDIWDTITFSAFEDGQDARSLTRILVNRLIEKGTPTQSATDEHVNALFRLWQLPMYDLNFEQIDVPLEDLKAEQESMLFAEMGIP